MYTFHGSVLVPSLISRNTKFVQRGFAEITAFEDRRPIPRVVWGFAVSLYDQTTCFIVVEEKTVSRDYINVSRKTVAFQSRSF
jgi:hypothetical protein